MTILTLNGPTAGAGMRVSGVITQLTTNVDTSVTVPSLGTATSYYINSDGFASNNTVLTANSKAVVGRFLSGIFSLFTDGNSFNRLAAFGSSNSPDITPPRVPQLHQGFNMGGNGFSFAPMVAKIRLINTQATENAKISIWLIPSPNDDLVPMENPSLLNEVTPLAIPKNLYEPQGRPLGNSTLELNNIMMRSGDILMVESNVSGVVAHWEAYDPSIFQGGKDMVAAGQNYNAPFYPSKKVGRTILW